MGLLDNGFKAGAGLAIGVGALMVAPAVVPIMAAVVKPLVKASIKSGLMFVEKTIEVIAETKELVEDLTAEARSELYHEREQMQAERSSARGPQA
jgi:hypothetical protein